MSSHKHGTILVVDDDEDILAGLTNRLQWLGYETISAQDGETALAYVQQGRPDLVLLDLELPRLSGMDVIRQLYQNEEGATPKGLQGTVPPIIILTAYATVSLAVEAMKLGAAEFLTKPFDYEHLAVLVKKLLEQRALVREIRFLRTELGARYHLVVGTSETMRHLVSTAQRAAVADIPVLLLGETGTGKELLARSIHQWSGRCSGPFMAINCAALPEALLENELFGHEKGAFSGATSTQVGKLEAAQGGTVFLDEIGDMPLSLQTRLLRVLQDKEFHRLGGTKTVCADVRFIAATNRDLQGRILQGDFRQDLFYRLNVFPIQVPPLRHRGEDIVLLAEQILTRESRAMKLMPKRLTDGARECLTQYHWPGNVRELENILIHALIVAPGAEIGPEHLSLTSTLSLPSSTASSSPPRSSTTYHNAIERYSRQLLVDALEESQGNQTKAASLLGLQRTYLVKLLKQRDISIKRSSR